MKAVVFDLDDTLLVDLPAVDGALARTAAVAEEKGVAVDGFAAAARAAARAIWRAAPTIGLCQALGVASWEGLAADFVGGHASMRVLEEWAPTYRAEAWRDTLASLGCDDTELASELAATFKRERRARHELFAESLGLLGALREDGWLLGLLTNGPPDLQREKIRTVGIEDAFDVVVVSGEAGVGKPDPAVFHLVLEGLGVAAGDAVMVGDNARRDHAAGRAVGMRTVWVNRWGGELPAEYDDPDASLTDLSGLAEILRSWR